MSTSATHCPVPGCCGAVPAKSVFCTEHYFALPKPYTSLIFRMQFKAERAHTAEDRAYFEGQKQGYVAACVRTLQGQSHGVRR